MTTTLSAPLSCTAIPRLLWVAAQAPTREFATAFGRAGWQLLHLDVSAGTVGWVRCLSHDAVLLQRQSDATLLLAPLRQASTAPLLVLGMPAQDADQVALYEMGVDALLAADATPPLLLARLQSLMRLRAPPASAHARSALHVHGNVDALLERLRRRLDAMPAQPLRIEEVPGVGYTLHVRAA